MRYLNGRLFLERCSNGYFFAKTYDTVMILMAWQIIQQRVYDTYSGKCTNHAIGLFWKCLLAYDRYERNQLINLLVSSYTHTKYFGRFEHILSYGVIRFLSCEMLVQSTLIGCSFLKELLLTGGQLFSQQCHQSTLLQNFYRIWLNIGKGYQIECLLLMNT